MLCCGFSSVVCFAGVTALNPACSCAAFVIFGRWNFHKLLVGADGALAGVSDTNLRRTAHVAVGAAVADERRSVSIGRTAAVLLLYIAGRSMSEKSAGKTPERCHQSSVVVCFRSQVFGSNLSPLEPDLTEAIEEALPGKSEPST